MGIAMTVPQPDDGSDPSSPCHAEWLADQAAAQLLATLTDLMDQAIAAVQFQLEVKAGTADDLLICLTEHGAGPQTLQRVVAQKKLRKERDYTSVCRSNAGFLKHSISKTV